ncbi:hypothetical protein M7I_0773 [Glarea lozoyensis 74030]|uniref:Uncharacterized protein n=1 Tax=Glarea lozoyensis (strain ATCC 74030 / MF5533) TaxID=1104152 RepID=H0EE99_GLAL7|nr:hypothetical protein M7I_0773 [Glarea lozoyensis 74030]
MRSLLLAAATVASFASTNAHYVLPEVFHNDVDYGHWEYVRHHGDSKYVYNSWGDNFEALYIDKPEE